MRPQGKASAPVVATGAEATFRVAQAVRRGTSTISTARRTMDKLLKAISYFMIAVFVLALAMTIVESAEMVMGF